MLDTIELPTLPDLDTVDDELQRELELVLASITGADMTDITDITDTTEMTETAPRATPALPSQIAFRVAQHSLARAALRRESVVEIGFDSSTGGYHLAVSERTNKF